MTLREGSPSERPISLGVQVGSLQRRDGGYMKNQYFGDQTDYIKYGILRALANSGVQLGIHWTLTEDDGSTDGSRTKYLRAPGQWRPYDPHVFDAICERVRQGERRLKLVEELDFVPGAIHSFDEWGSCPSARLKSIESLLSRLPPSALVFLDPDNGIEVGSARRGSRSASKYVFFDEISMFWRHGHSVIIYQHYPRVQRVPYVQHQLTRLGAVLPQMGRAALLTSHVAFLACIQDHHTRIAKSTISQITERWAPHVGAIDIDGTIKTLAPKSQPRSAYQQELPL